MNLLPANECLNLPGAARLEDGLTSKYDPHPASEPPVEDTELVAESLDGNRDAFRQIVERYQTLICSLIYSAIGDVSRSEDLAQETFLIAWKRLGDLREPAKLRAWLSGIARFVIRNELRRRGNQPLHVAEPLEALEQTAGAEPLPCEQVMSQEEMTLLWRHLLDGLMLSIKEYERLPVGIWNPLQRTRVLELREDAVKQRLARGRKLLAEQMVAFVEGALANSRPGKAFTLAVVAALPLAQ